MYRPSTPYNAETEHVRCSPIRQTLLVPSAKPCEVSGGGSNEVQLWKGGVLASALSWLCDFVESTFYTKRFVDVVLAALSTQRSSVTILL